MMVRTQFFSLDAYILRNQKWKRKCLLLFVIKAYFSAYCPSGAAHLVFLSYSYDGV